MTRHEERLAGILRRAIAGLSEEEAVKRLFELGAVSRRAAAEAMRRRFRATETLPCEDPSYGDAVQSANARAYAEDAKCFRG